MNKKMYLLITGASSGIGREIAVQLSTAYNLILNGRNRERLLETLNDCDKSNQHLIWQYNLATVDRIEEAITQFMINNNCTIHSFVHSAGYMKAVPLKMISVDLFQTTFNINVIAPAVIAKVLTKKKINNHKLRNIVFISSNISNFGAKAFGAYAASKAAIDGLMRCLSVELAPEIRVNSVLPGGICTPMTEHLYADAELVERMETAYPLGLGTTRDISDAVSFLLGDNARWITGQQLTVDGGRTINITG
jgi:NAD(P)-dependent dehydrogenase (short-subunit alcohol dehydrogenase family)